MINQLNWETYLADRDGDFYCGFSMSDRTYADWLDSLGTGVYDRELAIRSFHQGLSFIGGHPLIQDEQLDYGTITRRTR